MVRKTAVFFPVASELFASLRTVETTYDREVTRRHGIGALYLETFGSVSYCLHIEALMEL